MSNSEIREGLEAALAAMTPALTTVWENNEYKPVVGTPHQEATLLLNQPDDSEFGGRPLKLGILQVTLSYPPKTGPAAAGARADLIEAAFPAGRSIVSGSTLITITRTAETRPGRIDAARWRVPVLIRWNAQS